MRRTATVIAFFALSSPLDFAAAQIPESQEIKFFLDSFAKLDKKELYKTLVSEATRIDGDALWCRKNRPESWEQTTDRLGQEIYEKISPLEYGRLLQRLDATYPSLHAKIELPEELNYRNKCREKTLPLDFAAEVRSVDGNNTSFVITSIKEDQLWKNRKELPKIGDKVIAINSRSMESWRKENFLFCKFALKSQCDTEFPSNFRLGLLSLDFLNQPSITLTLQRETKTWELVVPVIEQSKFKKKSEENTPCVEIKKLYPDYKLVFGKGKNVCLFEKIGSPTTALMSIPSFVPVEHNGKKFSPKQEAELLLPFWQKVSAKYKNLIIDVSGNHGGDIPGHLTALIVDKPFQDQWMQFKKTVEFERVDFRAPHFTNGIMSEKAYAELDVWKNWQSLKYGDFLPQIPQFCVDEGTNCLSDRYQPAQHKFSGNVAVIVDQWCVSSCSGFVWTLKNYLPAERVKLIGFPDSADTTYERYRVNAWLSPLSKSGFEISIQPRRYRPENYRSMLLLSWHVSATRTTDEHGNILSMIPIAIDRFVPWQSNKKKWLKEALKQVF